MQGIRYRGQAHTPSNNAFATGQSSQGISDNMQNELDALSERWRATAPSGVDQTSPLREELRRRGVLTENVERILQANSSYQSPATIDSRTVLARYNSMPWNNNPVPAHLSSADSARARLPPPSSWNTSSSFASSSPGEATRIPNYSSRTATSEHNWSMPMGSRFDQSNPNRSSATASSAQTLHGAHPTPIDTSASSQSDSSSSRYLEQVQGWQLISQQVMDMEYLVGQYSIPSVDMMFRIRSQLQNMLEERQNQNTERMLSTSTNHRLFPSTAGPVETMMDRVTRVYERVDQITLIQQAQRIRTDNTLYSQLEPSQIYLATHPDGRQSVILPPGSRIGASLENPFTLPSHTASGSEPQTNNHHAANAAVVQDAVRQALINQRQRNQQQLRDANGVVGIGRYLRRGWMFIRMYFFCYMVSETGTWTRIVLVTCAVLVTVLSDTDIPQQLHRAIVAPFQRHLEGLAHMGGPADQSVQTSNEAGENRDNAVPQGMPSEILQFLRRAERSIVLLLASLVPGIGERQVEARNAAEAERARREEEQEQERERERQVEREREQEQTQGLEGVSEQKGEQAGTDAAAISTTTTTTTPVEQPEQTA